jgi:hypothetical protein
MKHGKYECLVNQVDYTSAFLLPQRRKCQEVLTGFATYSHITSIGGGSKEVWQEVWGWKLMG